MLQKRRCDTAGSNPDAHLCATVRMLCDTRLLLSRCARHRPCDRQHGRACPCVCHRCHARPGNAVGRLRDTGPAAHSGAHAAIHTAPVSGELASVDGLRPPDTLEQPTREFPGGVRPVVCLRPALHVGSRARGQVRATAMVSARGAPQRAWHAAFLRRPLHERDDVLRAWAGRRGAGGTGRAVAGRRGDRLESRSDVDAVLVHPDRVPVLCAPGGSCHHARRMGRLPADRDRDPDPTGAIRRRRAPRDILRGLGAVVRRPPREPPVLPGRRILPVPASPSVLGCCAGGDPRRVGARQGRYRRRRGRT